MRPSIPNNCTYYKLDIVAKDTYIHDPRLRLVDVGWLCFWFLNADIFINLLLVEYYCNFDFNKIYYNRVHTHTYKINSILEEFEFEKVVFFERSLFIEFRLYGFSLIQQSICKAPSVPQYSVARFLFQVWVIYVCLVLVLIPIATGVS